MKERFDFNTYESQLLRVERFVTAHFSLRQCKRYVCNDVTTDKRANNPLHALNDCVCGRSFDWHKKQGSVKEDELSSNEPKAKVEQWGTESDTTSFACNTFGKLVFSSGEGFDDSTIVPGAAADYLRLSGGRDSSAEYFEKIYTLMTATDLWGLPRPQLIIEVVGMARKLQYVDQDILDRFNAGLIRAAKTAKAWIVTSGTNCGIMGLVGDAVSRARMTHPDNDITCIGIGSWGIIDNREQLVTLPVKPRDQSTTNRHSSFGVNHLDVNVNGSNSAIRRNSLSPAPQRRGAVIGSGHDNAIFSVESEARRMSAASAKSKASHNDQSMALSPMVLQKLMPMYTVERPENCTSGIPLNPGHNCFLLVDNGKEKRFGEEVDFRARFLHFLSQKTLRGTNATAVSTPLVLLVVGGGTIALRAVELSIAGRSCIPTPGEPLEPPPNWARPIVILPHFGGVSDLLAFAYEITATPAPKESKMHYHFVTNSAGKKVLGSRFPPDFDHQIRSHPAFEQIFQFIPETLRAEEEMNALKRIRNCLRYRSMLTVVDLGEGNEQVQLDLAILNAILKSNFGSPASTFELAQLWNRGDVAKGLLSRYEKEIRQQVDMKTTMNRAIMYGQSDFFKLLIEYDLVDLHAFLTLYQIRSFYTNIFLKRRGRAGKTTCVWLFRSLILNRITEETLSDVGNPALLEKLGHILSSLLGCYLDNVFTEESSYKIKLVEDTMQTVDQTLHINAKQLRPYETSMRDLFILQLLLHRTDFATYIWKKGHDHLGSALMASIFLKSLSKEANRLDMTDLGIAYHDAAHEWQDRAIQLLAMCYEQDPIICSRLLRRSLLTWQGATLLELAFYGNTKKFMEQPAVQTTLGQIWLGQMATFTRQTLIYLTLFPPLLPFLIFRIRFEMETASVDHVRSAGMFDDFAEQRGVSSLIASVAPRVSNNQDIKLTRASLFDFNKEGRISVFKAVYLLYSAPIAKYITHSVANVAFLFVFSVFILDGSRAEHISWLEIFVWICCAIYFCDILREGFGKDNLSFNEQVQDFFWSMSTIVEIICLLLVIVSAVLRLIGSKVDFVYPHTTYSLACVLYWVKALRIFLVTASVGPKVITLVNMLRDMAFFILIYVIALLSFSVPIYALMYPRQEIQNAEAYFLMLRDIAYQRMWNLFYVDMDHAKNSIEGSCRNPMPAPTPGPQTSEPTRKMGNLTTIWLRPPPPQDQEPCSSRNVIGITLYILYMLFTNIMLLNMLIAMFAHTVNKTRQSAARLWRFDMYRFLCEYYYRPVMPGPLMFFELIYRFVIFINRKVRGSSRLHEDTDLKHYYRAIRDHNYRKLEMFERSSAEMLLVDASSPHSNNVAGVVKGGDNSNLAAKMAQINKRIQNRIDRLESKLVKSIENKLGGDYDPYDDGETD